jgi:hypothetical protein
MVDSLVKPTRRGLLTGLVALVAAPAIIKVSSIMPINSGLLSNDVFCADVEFAPLPSLQERMTLSFWIKGHSFDLHDVVSTDLGTFKVTEVANSSEGWQNVMATSKGWDQQ